MLANAGHEVGYTRTLDKAVSLSDRAKMANSFNADLFVSIHCNSAKNKAANGVETFAYSQGKSNLIAKTVQNKLVQYLGLQNRGAKTANFAVLRETNMPAILVELAFISNQAEEALLSNVSFQEKAAIAIFEGITGQAYQTESEETEMIYNYIDENMPEWARPTIQKLVDKGILKGNEKGELGLNDTMLKLLVINDRAGLYGK